MIKRKKTIIVLAVLGVLLVVRVARRTGPKPDVHGSLTTLELDELSACVKGEMWRDVVGSLSADNIGNLPQLLNRWWSTRIVEFEVTQNGEVDVLTSTRTANGRSGEDFRFARGTNGWVLDKIGSWVRVDKR